MDNKWEDCGNGTVYLAINELFFIIKKYKKLYWIDLDSDMAPIFDIDKSFNSLSEAQTYVTTELRKFAKSLLVILEEIGG